MTYVIINPNSTASMTNAMVRQARSAAPDLEFDGWTSRDGPPAIQGPADGAAATPPLLALVDQARGADGIIIGCFDDTGLTDAARRVPCPVVGIGQAAYHHAALRQWRFSVVTTLSVSVPVLEQNIAQLGLASYLGRVRAAEVPVLALDNDPAAATGPILRTVEAALAQDSIDAVILGCAGMVHVVDAVRSAVSAPVIDPVDCAVRALPWLAAPRVR